MKKINALANFLEVKTGDLKQSSYDKNIFELDNEEYLILTESQAERYTREEILNSAWAFNTWFIMNHAKKAFEGMEEYIKEIQENKCESANDFILQVIKNKNEFIKEAIQADGRGHFLSRYDGVENEFDDYYIYRIN